MSGLPLKDLETKLTSERLIVGSNLGQELFKGFDPKEITPTTWLVRDEDVFGNYPDQYEIPSLELSKDIDTVITNSLTIYRFIENTGKWELWAGTDYIEFKWQVLTDAVVINWNMNLGIMAEVTLKNNRTLANPTNLKKGTYSLLVKQDATGGRMLSLDTAYKSPSGVGADLTLDPNAVDLLTFISDGTYMYLATTRNYL